MKDRSALFGRKDHFTDDEMWEKAEIQFLEVFLTHPLRAGETRESRRQFLRDTEKLPFDERICRRMTWLLGPVEEA